MTRDTKSTKTGKGAEKHGHAAAPRGSERLDNGFLETLVGYNARRAWSQISTVFSDRMAPYGLKQVDFSVLSLLAHNPGATSRQLCATLDSRGLIARRPHPRDGRAVGLYLTSAGEKLTREAEQAVQQAELDASAKLNSRERETLIRLLQRLYL